MKGLYHNQKLCHFPIVKGVEKMNLFINTSDVKNFIKHGFEYKKSNDNKYNRLEYMIYCDGFDYMILIAEWAKGEKTALLKIEKEICEGISYMTLELPNVIYDLINKGLLKKG